MIPSETEVVMSQKVQIQPEGVPTPKGSLSHGLLVGGFVFTSGAVAFHPETGEIVGTTVEEQTRQTLGNLAKVLAARGLTFDDAVRVTVHLADVRRDFKAFDTTYREFFSEPFPVRTTVGSTLAVDGLLVEIDLVAATL